MSWLLTGCILMAPLALTALALRNGTRRRLAIGVVSAVSLLGFAVMLDVGRIAMGLSRELTPGIRAGSCRDAFRAGLAQAQDVVNGVALLQFVTFACLLALALSCRAAAAPPGLGDTGGSSGQVSAASTEARVSR
jgi:hypothetical protein